MPNRNMIEAIDDVADEIDRLIHARNFWQGLFDEIPMPSLVVDGYQRFVAVNKALIEVTGYTLDELHDMHLNDLLPRRDHRKHNKEFEKFVRAPKIRLHSPGVDAKLRTKYGREIPVDISLAYLEHAHQNFHVAYLTII